MPRLALVATGGTIAGLGSDANYTAGLLDAGALLAAQPALAELASWQLQQAFSLDSRDLEPSHWLTLAATIQPLLDDPAIDGIVITHGTDTLEETAFALALLLPAGKPVVMTAAMRPANSAEADGPANLLQAARVACCAEAAGRGVLVVAQGQILAAARCHKADTQALDALRASAGSAIGQVEGEQVIFTAHAPALPQLALTPGKPLPRVDILYGHAGMPADLVAACVTAGARGLVLALTGHGSVPAALRPALQAAQQAGVSIVRASRIASGGVWPDCNEDDQANGFIAAGALSPQQARVALLLALATGKSPAALFKNCR